MKTLNDGCTCVSAEEIHLLTAVPLAEREKGDAALDRAYARGFQFCLAVFTKDGEYDGLWVRAGESDSLNWGRGSRMAEAFFFRDGKPVPDPDYKMPPPALAWESHGYQCEVCANGIGYFCGYVTVPVGHPWNVESYDDIGADVHGGLTYGHKNDDGSFQVGFDCAHSGDAPSPEYVAEQHRKYLNSYARGESYDTMHWTVDMVKRETDSLARQAQEAASKPTMSFADADLGVLFGSAP